MSVPTFDDVKKAFEELHKSEQNLIDLKSQTIKAFGERIIARMANNGFLRCCEISWGGFAQKYDGSFHRCHSDNESENISNLWKEPYQWSTHIRIKIGDKRYDYDLTPIKYDREIMNDVVKYVKHNWIYQPIRRDQNKSVELQSDELRKLINKECKFVPNQENTQVHNGTNSFVIETTFLNELLLHQQHHMQTAEVILDDVIKS
jgi:hypothetical protein